MEKERNNADSDDRLIRELDLLTEVVDDTIADGRQLKKEIRAARDRRRKGASAAETVAASRPIRIFVILELMGARLSRAAGSWRRALVGTLVREGERVSAIARLLGVSHQRISSLLRRHEPLEP